MDSTQISDADGSGGADGDEAYCPACQQSYPMDTDVCPKDGARLAKLKAQPDALLGRVFEGRYEVRMQLGQGGMGTVYRGWQLSVDREVAIKVIHPKHASDRTAVKRFLREARLSSRLSQPSIINVYDFGQSEDGILFLVMELLRGHTLGRELEAQNALPLRRVTTMAMQLCDALDAAHAQGIVHRDLKPGNIIILDEPPGRDLIKVLDFGLAKSLVTDTSSVVTRSSALLGTPLYMAPEQIQGIGSDQRGDLYALGCILFHMLTGQPPFLGDSVNVVLADHLSKPPPPLPIGVPPALARVVMQLLEKEPAKRIASARQVREVLQALQEAGFMQADLSDTTPDIPIMAPVLPSDAVRARQAADSDERNLRGKMGRAPTVPADHGHTISELGSTLSADHAVATAGTPSSVFVAQDSFPGAASGPDYHGLDRSITSNVLVQPSPLRRWAPIALVVGIVLGIVLVLAFTSGKHAAKVAAPERPVAVDAALATTTADVALAAVTTPDAAPPVDAAPIVLDAEATAATVPKDAGKPKRPKPPKKPDAGVGIDFIHPH